MNEADLIAEQVTVNMVQQTLNELEQSALDMDKLLEFSKQLTLHIVDELIEEAILEVCECMNPLRPRDLELGYCSKCSRRVSIVMWRVRHE